MIPLLNAIYAKFAADGTLTAAFAGGLHRDRAPEGALLPYVVSHVVSSKLENAYGGPFRSDTQIRFTAYAVGHDASAGAMDAFIAAFDDALLTLSSGVNDSVTRLTDPLPTLDRHDAQGNDVWQWAVTYEYGVTG